MRMCRVTRQLVAAAMGGVLLSGCGSSALQIPTLATFDGYDSEIDTLRPHTTLSQDHYAQPLPIDILCFDALTRDPASGKGLDGEPYWSNDRQTKLQKCNLNPRLLEATRDSGDRAVLRNAIQNELMRRSDQICSYYLTRIVYTQFVGTAATNAIKTVATAFKTISGTVDTFAEALAADASTSLASPEVLKWQVFQLTANKIAKARKQLRTKIRISQFLRIDQYGAYQAIYDTERYHSTCNFPSAYAIDEDNLSDDFTVPSKASVDALAEGAELAKKLDVLSVSTGPAKP